MDTYIKLFHEICKRGFFIKINTKYYNDMDHLPNCLIFFDDHIRSDIFEIIPIGNNGTCVCLFEKLCGESILYPCQCGYQVFIDCRMYKSFEFDYTMSWNYIMVNLDLLTHFIYTGNLTQDPSQDILDKYKNNFFLKIKMVQNLTELYMHKFIYLSNILPIVEIKFVIVEALIKLDKWNDLLIS